MDLLSSIAPSVETTPARKPFPQLDIFAQQLRSSGPPLVRDVQEAYTNTKNSLSRTASERGRDPGKFNFGVGTGGGGAAVRRSHRLGKQRVCCFGWEVSHHRRLRLQKCH